MAWLGEAWSFLEKKERKNIMAYTLIEAWVEGVQPILLHRATEEALRGETRQAANLQEKEDPRVTAEKAIYRMEPSKQIAFPGGAFGRMLREAGNAHKAKGSRKTLKWIIPAAVLVTEDLVGFYQNDRKTKVTDFEVDARPVTIPATKGRVMRYRARLNEWSVRVHLRIDQSIMAASIVRQLLAEGGAQVGIGDFRPEKGGPFGVFSVVEWKEVSAPAGKTEAQKRNGRTLAAEQ
jgi:hypothetical protein